MFTTVLASAAILFSSPQKVSEPISASAIIPAPVREVWNAYTTSEGITKWMVAAGTVDMRVGGKYRTSYTKNSKLDGPDVIENTILSYDPERMISLKTTRFPHNFPFKAAIKKVWTVLYFNPQKDGTTEVVCRMAGFDDTEESVKMKAFFKQGNQYELDELAKFFKK